MKHQLKLQEKSNALAILLKHIDEINKSNNISVSLLNEINHDNKIILKEINNINKKLKKS